MSDFSRWLKTSDIAELLLTTPRTVGRYIERGELEAIEVAKGYRISEEAFMRFLEKRKVTPKNKTNNRQGQICDEKDAGNDS